MKRNLEVIQPEEACCVPAAKPTLEAAQAKSTATFFAALADETRLTILNLLAESQGEVCVCDITDSFKQKQPTISHHLRILKEAGLVTDDKRGKWVYYSLVKGKTDEIKDTLDKVLSVSAVLAR